MTFSPTRTLLLAASRKKTTRKSVHIAWSSTSHIKYWHAKSVADVRARQTLPLRRNKHDAVFCSPSTLCLQFDFAFSPHLINSRSWTIINDKNSYELNSINQIFLLHHICNQRSSLQNLYGTPPHYSSLQKVHQMVYINVQKKKEFVKMGQNRHKFRVIFANLLKTTTALKKSHHTARYDS